MTLISYQQRMNDFILILMSASFDNLRDIKMVESQNKTWIDREKSLRMVRLAEYSLAKRRSANSHQKQQSSLQQQVKGQKDTLICQIHHKLSHIENVELSVSESVDRDQVEKRNVFRLERMLQRIKRERNANLQPTVIHSREVLQNKNRIKRNHNLQLMLNEVNQARQQVKIIKKLNSQILGKDPHQNHHQSQHRRSTFNRDNPQVERTQSRVELIGDVHAERQFTVKQNVVDSSQVASASSLLIEKDQTNTSYPRSPFQVNPVPEVIYSWKVDGELGNRDSNKVLVESRWQGLNVSDLHNK